MDIILNILVCLSLFIRSAVGQGLISHISQHAMSHVSGGSLMTQYADVVTCKLACIDNINCRAIDFDFNDDTCWFHYDSSVCNDLMTKRNCMHYKYVTCDEDRHVNGGTLQEQILDVTSCINACVGTCKAADFNAADNACWFHKSDTACSPLTTKGNCRHYKRINCDDQDLGPSPISEMEPFPGKHGLRGIFQSGISTAAMCIRHCQDNPLCRAVDFETDGNTCWFHGEESFCTPLHNRGTVTHYKIASCARPVSVQPFQSQHIRGGSLSEGFSDVVSCAYGCSVEPSCRAIDYNTNDNSCWFHTPNTACSEPRGKQGCVHLKLVPCASGMIAEPDTDPVPLPGPAPNPDPAPNPVSGPDSNPVPLPDPVPDPGPVPIPDPDPIIVPVPSPSDGQCGSPALSAQTRIVGGEEASPHSWPWQVTLLRGTLNTGVSLVCGGSLISPQYVITAAHCVGENPMPTKLWVTLGDHDLSTVEESQVTSSVQSIIVNANFNAETLDSDVALIKLDTPLTYTPEISPVCLPDSDTVFAAGMECVVSGWGDTRGTPATIRSRLNQALVPLVVQDSCIRNYNGQVTNNMLCAGLPQGGRDSCSGDSGGPLVCQRSDQRWYLAGIVSFGNDCAIPNFPGVYTRVTKFVSWITDNMQ